MAPVLPNAIELDLTIGGDADEPLHRLGDDEWLFFDQHVADAGLDVRVYANLSQKRAYRLPVFDGDDKHVADLRIDLQVPATSVAEEVSTPEFGTSLPPIGILRVPRDMPGGMFTLDKKWVFFVSRTAERGTTAVVVPVTTMHFFNATFGYNFYTKSYRESGRVHPFSAKRPLPLAIATKSMWMDGFHRWYGRGLGDPLKLSFVPDTMVGEFHALQRASLLVVPGRSEFWLREARRSLDAHIQGGKNALFLSGETMYVEAVSSDCGDRFDVRRPDRHWGKQQSDYPLQPSIGPNPFSGGFLSVKPDQEDPGHGTYRVIAAPPALVAAGLHQGSTIPLPSTAYDGLPLDGYADDGTPIVSLSAVEGFDRFQLLAWAGGKGTPKGTIAAFCAFRPGPKSGTCVHAGSMAWTKVIGSGMPEAALAEAVVGNVLAALREGGGASLFDWGATSGDTSAGAAGAPAASPQATADRVSRAVPVPTGTGLLTTEPHGCNLCGAPVSGFKRHLDKPRSCATCGSSERVRTFIAAYGAGALGVDLRNKKMLLVSPSRPERRFLGEIEGLELVTLDIRPVLKPDVVADLCNMPEVPSADYDFVYASCVLNCVYDLHGALTEIHRVLKPGGSFLNVEILNPGGRTVERTDESVITQHYGREDFERYRVGGHRSFGELDYPEILGAHFEHVDRVWVLDLPYDKGQWWHVASRGAEAPDGAPAAADCSASTSSTESPSRAARSRWWRRTPTTGQSSG
jgi:SAM-dependent methyltransferase